MAQIPVSQTAPQTKDIATTTNKNQSWGITGVREDLDTVLNAADLALATHIGLSSGVHGVVGSVVGTTDTQTLTNKSLSDSTTFIINVTTASKKFKFDLSGSTASTTLTLSTLQTTSQTLQIPNLTATDTVNTLGLAQTISGQKTYSTQIIATSGMQTGVAGPVYVGGSGIISNTVEMLNTKYTNSANTNAAAFHADINDNLNSAMSAATVAGDFIYRRTIASGSVVDAGLFHTPIQANISFNVPTGATLTTSGGVVRYAGMWINTPTLTGTGTLAIDNYAGVYVNTSSLATGTNKYGIYVAAQSGATNNYGIFSVGNAVIASSFTPVTNVPNLGIGTTSTISVPAVEGISNLLSYTTAALAGNGINNKLLLTTNTANASSLAGIRTNLFRSMSTSVSETAIMSTVISGMTIDVPTGQSYTNTATSTPAAFRAGSIAVTGGGSYVGNFAYFSTLGDATTITGNKFGLLFGSHTGASGSHVMISDSTTPGAGNWSLYFASTNPNYLNGPIRTGTNAVVSQTNEQLTVLSSIAANSGSVGVLSQLNQSFNGALNTGQSGITGIYQRIITTSQTDTATQGAVKALQSFNVPTSQTLTHAGGVGFSGLDVISPVNNGAGTLALTGYAGIFVEASALATGTNKYGLYIDSQSGATTNYAIKTNTGFVQFLDRTAIASAPSTFSLLVLGSGTSPLTGTTQIGVFNQINATSAATAEVRAYQASLSTAAATTVGIAINYLSAAMTKGASGTITRAIDYYVTGQTVGTNNAGIADSAAFSGNWFINQSGSTNSLFTGSVGIGVSPSFKLDVLGTSQIKADGTSGTGTLTLQPATSTNATNLLLNNGGSGVAYVAVEGNTGGVFATGSTAFGMLIGTSSTRPIQFYTNGSVRATVDTAGKMGIGITSSTYLLEVKDAMSVGSIGFNGAYNLRRSSDGAVLAFVALQTNELRIGMGGGSGFLTFCVDTGGGTTERMRIDGTSGSVGIAQTAPQTNGGAGAKNLVIGDSTVTADTGITLLTNSAGTAGNSRIYFSRTNGSATSGGLIQYTHAGTENFAFSINGTSIAQINSFGLGVGTTNPGSTQKFYTKNVQNSAGGTVSGGAFFSEYQQTVASGNTASHFGNYFSSIKTVAANSSASHYGVTIDIAATSVAAGVTDSGSNVGLNISAQRQLTGATDSGTLSNAQIGQLISFGNQGSTGITANSYGLKLAPLWTTGTVQNSYGIYLMTASTGGTGPVNNYFAIYQEDANAKNFFAGNSAIGVAPSTTYRLTVQGSGNSGARTVLFKASDATTSSINNTAGILVIQNTQATNNNFSAIKFADASGNSDAGIFGINEDHSGKISIAIQTSGTSGASAGEKARFDGLGRIGFGTTGTLTNWGVYVNNAGSLTGSSSGVGLGVAGTWPTVVTDIQVYRSSPTTTASAYTVADLCHFQSIDVVKGSGSSVTTQVGFLSNTLSAATNNASFADNIAFSGNYFINQSGTNPSQFGANVFALANLSGNALSMVINNTSTTNSSATQSQLFIKNDAGVGMRLVLNPSTYTGASLLTGGPTGKSGMISTDTAGYPLVFGTGGIYAMHIDSNQEVTHAKAQILTQISTPSTPAAGFNKIYAKSDNQLYMKNSSGIETPIGSGSGGTKNYLTVYTASLGTGTANSGNGDAEFASTTGWNIVTATMSAQTPTGAPSVGTAASISNFQTITSSGSPAAISKNNSFYLQGGGVSATWTAGQGIISDPFYIDAEDQAKVLSFSFHYKLTSGTSGTPNFSGTSANTFAVWLYDVDAGLWIQPAGVYSMTQNSGVGRATGSFQTTASGTRYRIAVIAANTTSPNGTVSLILDDFVVGPSAVVQGTPVTDWASYTPSWTSTGTAPAIGNGTLLGKWRRVGDSIECNVSFTAGSTTTYGTGQYLFSLPSGLSFDATKLPTGSVSNALGSGFLFDSSAGQLKSALPRIFTTTSTTSFMVDVAESTTNLFVTNTVPYTWATSDSIEFTATAPISGWSSNVQMSNDTDTRLVAARYNQSVGGSSIGSGATAQIVNFESLVYDTHGAVTLDAGALQVRAAPSTSGWKYTVPVSGLYEVRSAFLTSAFTNVVNFNVNLQVWKNGVAASFMDIAIMAGTSSQSQYPNGLAHVMCNAGDILQVIVSNTAANACATTGANTYVEIKRISGPATVAATETVSAKYGASTGQTLANGSTIVVNFNQKYHDTHNAVTTGASPNWKFTCPVSGKYHVSSEILWASGPSNAVSSTAELYLTVNGSTSVYLDSQYNQATNTTFIRVGGSGTVQCNAGDTITIVAFQNMTATSTMNNSAGINWVCIDRIGN